MRRRPARKKAPQRKPAKLSSKKSPKISLKKTLNKRRPLKRTRAKVSPKKTRVTPKIRVKVSSKLRRKLETQAPVYLRDGYLERQPVQQQPAGFTLPSKYGEDKAVLMVRDPWWLFAYWEVTPRREQETVDAIHRAGLTREKSVLRVYDVTGASVPDSHSFFDIELQNFASTWYIDVGVPDREWVVEVGIRTREGRFFMLVRSNVVRTPRFGVSDVLDEEWMLPDELYWKLFGMSGLGRQKSSLDVREILERYLKSVVSSERPSSHMPEVPSGAVTIK